MTHLFKTKITAWGNSYGLRIPKDFMDTNSEYFKHSLEVLFDTKSQELVIKPARTLKTKTYFAEQLKKMKPAKEQELDWGKPQGKEIW